MHMPPYPAGRGDNQVSPLPSQQETRTCFPILNAMLVGPRFVQVVEEGCRVLYALFLWQMRPLFERLRLAGSAPAPAGKLLV